MELWGGNVDWNCGVELLGGTVGWNCGAELWGGTVGWNFGVERWVELSGETLVRSESVGGAAGWKSWWVNGVGGASG